MKRILAVLAAAAALALGGLPAAAAGGWAVTYLDPAPSRFEGGTSYALGFWVLQHGSHPFEGELGAVGLRFTGANGKSLLFGGTALPEAGHYATSVVVPEGVWKVEGVQGLFQPYEVGTLTVPGGLKVRPVPSEMVAPMSAEKSFWGAVRPPGFPNGGPAVITRTPQGQGSAGATEVGQEGSSAGVGRESSDGAGADRESPGARQGSGGVPVYTLVIAALGGSLVAVVALWLLPRSRLAGLPHRPRSPEPAEPSGEGDSPGETIVISGR
ncbi:hypothetical protein [Nonomuraea angiospora]|uniref:hypothetical protein n=1 Tax=Nonomuraea angiospora TaxID=46172 RepID=UPI0029AC02E9|nr:hypothetical protein [Nonomuraea angiospora]MDX3102155.1 hypothetical protein [Nonomuraea angiospora]